MITSAEPDARIKTDSELLEQFREDNLRLVAENLRLRGERQKIKQAFAKHVDRAFIKSLHVISMSRECA